jgi:hypothetical protein
MAKRLKDIGFSIARLFGSNFDENEVEEIESVENRLQVDSKLIDSNKEEYTASNPLPTQDIDGSQRMALNSVFGEKITGRRVPTIAGQFQYGLRSDDAKVDIVSTGATTIEDSMLKLSTGTASDGHVGIQGSDYLRYIPGFEAWALFTAVFATPTVDSVQRIGIFDYDGGNGNGFFIGFNGTTFGITRRRAGVDYFTQISTASVLADGSFDPTKGNAFRISYGYLGFAPITFSILKPDNQLVEFAKIEYPNTSDETHISNTNIPLRAEMTNDGNTTNLEMRIGSVSAGIIDGAGADPIARWFSFSGGVTTITAVTPNQLFTFRNKSEFFGLTNKISTQLALISAATEGNKPVGFSIRKNPDITTPGTFTDINTTDSVMEYSIDQVNDVTTGELLMPWKMARSDSFFENVEEYLLKLRPNEYAVIIAQSQNTNDVEVAMRWKELF